MSALGWQLKAFFGQFLEQKFIDKMAEKNCDIECMVIQLVA